MSNAEILPASSKIDYQTTPAGIVPKTVDEALTVAKSFAMGGLFPDIKNAGQALTKILAGAEYGVGPASAMNSFHIVQGKIGMDYKFVGALIKRSGKYDYKVLTKTVELCVIEFFQNGESIGVEEFTIAQAKAAGTQNLAKYPDVMLFARCLTKGARFYCPDALGSCYVREELEDMQAALPAASVGDAVLNHLQPPAESVIDGEVTEVEE